jgi:hypothetical protein
MVVTLLTSSLKVGKSERLHLLCHLGLGMLLKKTGWGGIRFLGLLTT